MLLPPRSVAFLTSFEKLAERGTSTLPRAVRSQLLFASIDAALYHDGFLAQFNISPSTAPQLLVIDIPGKRYGHDGSVCEYEELEGQLEGPTRMT